MKTIYLVVGCPGSGKTWICTQLQDKFVYVPHDAYEEKLYPSILFRLAGDSKPVIGEVPFGIAQIQRELLHKGAHVELVFIKEPESVLRDRYEKREGRAILQGHLTRQKTYEQRAQETGSFIGTSDECLKFLRSV